VSCVSPFHSTAAEQEAKETRRLYVGKFDERRVREEDVHDVFKKYGKISAIYMKRGFCFIEYAEERDAEKVSARPHRTLHPAQPRSALILFLHATAGSRDGWLRIDGLAHSRVVR
jgi:hypothetical protein